MESDNVQEIEQYEKKLFDCFERIAVNTERIAVALERISEDGSIMGFLVEKLEEDEGAKQA